MKYLNDLNTWFLVDLRRGCSLFLTSWKIFKYFDVDFPWNSKWWILFFFFSFFLSIFPPLSAASCRPRHWFCQRVLNPAAGRLPGVSLLQPDSKLIHPLTQQLLAGLCKFVLRVLELDGVQGLCCVYVRAACELAGVQSCWRPSVRSGSSTTDYNTVRGWAMVLLLGSIFSLQGKNGGMEWKTGQRLQRKSATTVAP